MRTRTVDVGRCIDETDDGWQIVEGVTIAVCPDCGFGQIAEGSRDDYTCPKCADAPQQSNVERLCEEWENPPPKSTVYRADFIRADFAKELREAIEADRRERENDG